MNTKIILSLGATALLASSLLAFSPQGGMGEGKNYACSKGKMMKGQKHRQGPNMVKMIMKLDLSDNQRKEIKEILKKSMQSAPNPKDAFTKTNFDKDKFIKLAKQRRDGKIERRAQMLENVYEVLNSSQKSNLKTMLDMRDIMRKNMMQSGGKNAKNCDGRR